MSTKPDPLASKSEAFHLFPGGVTVCVRTLACGFSVVGQSTPSNPGAFNEEAGRRHARNSVDDQVVRLRVLVGKLDEYHGAGAAES